jgi:hypothetical protein
MDGGNFSIEMKVIFLHAAGGYKTIMGTIR